MLQWSTDHILEHTMQLSIAGHTQIYTAPTPETEVHMDHDAGTHSTNKVFNTSHTGIGCHGLTDSRK